MGKLTANNHTCDAQEEVKRLRADLVRVQGSERARGMEIERLQSIVHHAQGEMERLYKQRAELEQVLDALYKGTTAGGSPSPVEE